jgi:gluconate kinase
MPPGLLQSQFDALEEPDESEALMIDVKGEVEEVVEAILRGIGEP